MKKSFVLTVLALFAAGYVSAEPAKDPRTAEVLFKTTLSAPIGVFEKVETRQQSRATQASIGVATSNAKYTGASVTLNGESSINTLNMNQNTTLASKDTAVWRTPTIKVYGGGQLNGGVLMAKSIRYAGDLGGTLKSGWATFGTVNTIDGSVTNTLQISRSPWYVKEKTSPGANQTATWQNFQGVGAGGSGTVNYTGVLAIDAGSGSSSSSGGGKSTGTWKVDSANTHSDGACGTANFSVMASTCGTLYKASSPQPAGETCDVCGKSCIYKKCISHQSMLYTYKCVC